MKHAIKNHEFQPNRVKLDETFAFKAFLYYIAYLAVLELAYWQISSPELPYGIFNF
jgi:hypothetical protein